MAVEDSSLNDEDSDFFSIGDVIEAVQALPNMDDELILDAADFLENKKNAQIFMALGFELRRKWLIRKLPRQIQISVKTLHGEVIGKLDILTSEKIAEVKAKIGAKTGISAENQRLIYAGRETVDDRSLADYDVRRFTSLHLIKRQGEITK